MKILIIGGTGFISLQIVRNLSDKGHTVFVYNRGNRNYLLPESVQSLTGNRIDSVKLKQVFSSEKFDVVVDMCAYNVADIKPLIDVLPNNIPHFVFCSSLGVYDFPTNSYLTNGEGNFIQNYGYNKLLCEQFLQKTIKNKLSIIRPAYVYGPNDPSYRILQIFEKINNSHDFDIPWSLKNNNTQLIFIDDLANAFCKIIETDNLQKENYDLAFPETVNFISLIEKIGLLLHKKAEFHYTNNKSKFPFELHSTQLIDALTAWEKLGIQPKYNLEKGLKETYNWFKKSQNKK